MVKMRDITFRKYEADDYEALSETIHALYREDPAGQSMDDAKITVTVAAYRQHPEKLTVILIEKGGTAIGYALLVYYWSNEYGGDILHIDESYIREA